MEDDASMQNLSKQKKQEFVNNLKKHWELKRIGVCASNKAAAIDCQGAVGRVSTEVSIC